MKFVETLNGWQRIWVVIGALWALAVLAGGVIGWPEASGVPAEDVYGRMAPANVKRLYRPLDRLSRLAAEYGGVRANEGKIIVRKGDRTFRFPSDATDAEIAEALRQDPVNADPRTDSLKVVSTTPLPIVVEGHQLDFETIVEAQAESKYDPDEVVSDFRAALNKALLGRRLAFTAMAGVWWAAPLGVLYALGWSVGWIRRGFAH